MLSRKGKYCHPENYLAEKECTKRKKRKRLGLGSGTSILALVMTIESALAVEVRIAHVVGLDQVTIPDHAVQLARLSCSAFGLACSPEGILCVALVTRILATLRLQATCGTIFFTLVTMFGCNGLGRALCNTGSQIRFRAHLIRHIGAICVAPILAKLFERCVRIFAHCFACNFGSTTAGRC